MQNQPQQVHVIVENIKGLAASAVVDKRGTVWVVIGETCPDPYRAAAEVMSEVLGSVLPAEVIFEYGSTCKEHKPSGLSFAS